MPKNKSEVEIIKRYTLFIRGVLILNGDDLEFLREGLESVFPSRGTYIRFNKKGINHYQTYRG